MAKERAAFLALLLFVVSAGPIKGYILTSYTANGYDSVGADNSLREMRALGVECVEIVFTWYLQTLNTTSIAPDLARTPSDHGIARMVKLAHSLNMSTAFKPHVDLVDDSWRAAIGVGYNESQWADFFGNLTAYLCHYADLAAANGVELFNLGTELEMTHERDADWRSVIAAVRQRAPQTKLWISPNYEYYVLPLPGYWFVPFWDALDFLGVDMYEALALKDDPIANVTDIGWDIAKSGLIQFYEQQFNATGVRKGFIFGEFGYSSFPSAANRPWACCEGPTDRATQAMLYQSFFDNVWSEPWFAGAFWWSWLAEYPNGEPCGTGFDVFKKPAADVLKKYYLPSSKSSSGNSSSIVATTTAPPPTYAAYAAAANIRSGTAPIQLYSNGVSTWTDWSWGATVDFKCSNAPFPGHAYSACVSIPSVGSLSLHMPDNSSSGVDLSSFSWLVMDVVVANTTLAPQELATNLCTCEACGGCEIELPAVWLGMYTSLPSLCTLSSNWTASFVQFAQVAIPIGDLIPAPARAAMADAAVGVIRVQIGTSFKSKAPVDPVVFSIDNIVFV